MDFLLSKITDLVIQCCPYALLLEMALTQEDGNQLSPNVGEIPLPSSFTVNQTVKSQMEAAVQLHLEQFIRIYLDI